ncbi:MAG: phosphopantothenoylcysteine decarboxylase [Verrucomicrobiota bacterium]
METNPIAPHAIVTCGPATTPIDDVRRITNFSTGELGIRIAEALLAKGWRVTCFKGSGATHRDPVGERLTLKSFQTNGDLLEGLLAVPDPDDVRVVFHAAALVDYEVTDILGPDNVPLALRKIPSFFPEVRLVLKPAFKVLPRMEDVFPEAKVVGWKFEMEGDRRSALGCAKAQLELCKTTLCVVNGAAFGEGFGIVDEHGLLAEVATRYELSEWLTRWVSNFYTTPLSATL